MHQITDMEGEGIQDQAVATLFWISDFSSTFSKEEEEEESILVFWGMILSGRAVEWCRFLAFSTCLSLNGCVCKYFFFFLAAFQAHQLYFDGLWTKRETRVRGYKRRGAILPVWRHLKSVTDPRIFERSCLSTHMIVIHCDHCDFFFKGRESIFASSRHNNMSHCVFPYCWTTLGKDLKTREELVFQKLLHT